MPPWSPRSTGLSIPNTDKEIADQLNERGVRSVLTTPWTAAGIGRLRHTYHLADRRTRLRAQGLLTPEELAARYDVVVHTRSVNGCRNQNHESNGGFPLHRSLNSLPGLKKTG
jgi:hypothetical protein